MNRQDRVKIITKLIADEVLPNRPILADAVSGPEPCATCGATGGKIMLEGIKVPLCHECFTVWREL